MAHLSVRDLRKSFGNVEVLHGISADIADGEFVAVLGESGCGKSTFLRILAGLEEASSGDVLIDGQSVIDRSPKERDVAMVFQTYALYPHMTVRENIDFPLELSGLDKAERARRIEATAATLNLTAYLDRKPRQLSGGQRQRVAMGRAIVREPKVFLFDEPLSNLDAKLRVAMRSEIRLLQQRLKVTSVYVTHDQVEALTMSDRVMLLNGGRIEQFAAPLELYDRPANVFVAGFVGSPPMNLVDAVATGGGVEALGTAFPSVAAVRAPDTVLGFRPEHVRIGEAPHAFEGKVILSENSGDRLLIVLDAGGTQLNLSLTERVPVRPGETLPCHVLPEHLHLFDRASGQRLN